jgi:hypothetical protein
MAAKKKSAIQLGNQKPKGIIDDIVGMGTKLVQKKTKDAARAYVASGRPMRRAAKKIGKLQKEYSNVPRSGGRAQELRTEARKTNDYLETHYFGRKAMLKDIEKTTGKRVERVRKKHVKERQELRKMKGQR